jgi:hypothetical protein
MHLPSHGGDGHYSTIQLQIKQSTIPTVAKTLKIASGHTRTTSMYPTIKTITENNN